MKIGIFIFDETKVSQQMLNKIFNVHKRDRIKKHDGNILGFGQYVKYKWRDIFEVALQAGFKAMILTGNNCSTILKQISHVTFNNLMGLWLCLNQINNIEPLSWIIMPNIQLLLINNNRIINFNCLKKQQWKSLGQFRVSTNNIKQLRWIQRFQFNPQINTMLEIDLCKLVNDHTNIQICSSLMKTSTNKLYHLNLNYDKRINQKQTKHLLQRKFTSPHFISFFYSDNNNDQ